jgi:hypothetical protein
MKKLFFPDVKKSNPTIYGYTEPYGEYKGYIKIGYTDRTVSERMKEHYPTRGPNNIERYKVLLDKSAMRDDGTCFSDHDVRKILIKSKFKHVGGEWIQCNVRDINSAIIAIKKRENLDISRNIDFKLRPEQINAITKTSKYFDKYKKIENKIPHFLWNCKMRFGKTFTAYKLAEKMNWKRVLILTFKPAVEKSWHEDLTTHVDFKKWEFVSKNTQDINSINKSKPFVCFASFQDFLGKTKSGGIKIKNKWAHKIKWDVIIFDEYHFGAWRESSKELLESESENEKKLSIINYDDWNEEISPLKTNHYLYLSGTPFRAISTGEFLEEQIFNWTYQDEQEAKENWTKKDNPYASLPRMVMMTYQLPDTITQITETGEYDEFDLNIFFKAEGKEEKSKFVHENEVNQWLNLIQGTDFSNTYTNLKLGKSKPVLPFLDSRLLNILSHTFWFLPSISSCYAMKNILSNNSFFHDFEVIVCAGTKAGVGTKAYDGVIQKMGEPLKNKSITLSCGKLTTGVTVKPWTGIFMLRNTSSPETYFQSSFRVQSPWTVLSEKKSILEEKIIKEECYIFDFAPNRALKLITDYSCRLNINETNPEKKVDEFIKFLPILHFNGSHMCKINASEVLEIGSFGTSGSQLARKFKDKRLVNVDDMTLKRLQKNPKAIEVLMKIEGFRSVNTDLEKIINKTDKINKVKKENEKLSSSSQKSLTDEERTLRSQRKIFQEKIQKFVTRIPVFMYLTEFREECLKDVITQLEPGLFQKITSINTKEFEILISAGLFDSGRMNSAISSFKRYENPSLHYKGYTKYKQKEVGLWDTKVSKEEFNSQVSDKKNILGNFS